MERTRRHTHHFNHKSIFLGCQSRFEIKGVRLVPSGSRVAAGPLPDHSTGPLPDHSTGPLPDHSDDRRISLLLLDQSHLLRADKLTLLPAANCRRAEGLAAEEHSAFVLRAVELGAHWNASIMRATRKREGRAASATAAIISVKALKRLKGAPRLIRMF
jgi:hypothetical protein